MTDGSGQIHDEIDPTKTVLNGHQDGMTNESTQIQDEVDPNEIVELALLDVETLQHDYLHILECIVSITNMQAHDVYDAIWCSKKVPKFTLLNRLPRKVAEEYHDQLVMNGIRAVVC
jgi:hypothetical protein